MIIDYHDIQYGVRYSSQENEVTQISPDQCVINFACSFYYEYLELGGCKK